MAPKGKKAVSQEELRRLMKEKQRATERQRRVQSPFAKYTSSGRLQCSVCGEHVKSEAMWQAHVLGRGHKERVGQLKAGQGQGVPAEKKEEENGGARKARDAGLKEVEKRKREEEEGDGVGKKAKMGGLPADFFQSKGPAGLGLLAGQYGEEDDDDEEEEQQQEEEHKGEASKVKTSSDALKPPEGAPGLPDDFFESALPTEAPPEAAGEEKAKPEPQLPEGFFDDPVRDARVRNVDTPREQMDREWEEFQKEMRMVNSASEAIVAEDDEEGRIERQIDEIDEQMECLRRVELLRARQEAARSRSAGSKGGPAEGSEEDEEEDEEKLLHVLSRDWRAKGALA